MRILSYLGMIFFSLAVSLFCIFFGSCHKESDGTFTCEVWWTYDVKETFTEGTDEHRMEVCQGRADAFDLDSCECY